MTVASGKKRAVLARHVRNRRLYDAIDQWAFCASQPAPAPAPSTTTAAPQETCTTKPYALWATASSASSTAAFATTPNTTNTPPGHTAKPPPAPRPLDNLRPWDVTKTANAVAYSKLSDGGQLRAAALVGAGSVVLASVGPVGLILGRNLCSRKQTAALKES